MGAASSGAIPKGADGNYYILSTFNVTSTVPQFLENGQTFPVSFSAQLDISSTLATLPAGFTLTVGGTTSFVISGGGSGGPFPGVGGGGSVTPPATTTIPPATASGTVTGVDKTKPIVYSMGSPLTSSIAIATGGTTLFAWNMSCTSTDPDIAATNGTLPPEPAPIVPPTAAAAPATAASPSFTG